MAYITAGYDRLSFLARLNWDRFLFAGTVLVALVAANYLGNELIEMAWTDLH